MLLSAEKICKNYTERPLLKEVSLYLNEGDKVGIIGINGTGKSTLLKILAGVETPDSGTIVTGTGVRVAYLPQNPDFSEQITVLEQVLKNSVHPEQKEYEAKSILNQLGITAFDQKVTLLSGGQKKRVAIAAALVSPCEVLILDEPTNHIDSPMVQWLEHYLASYRGGLIMVTHDRYFLDRVVNRIVEMDHGRLFQYQSGYSKFVELKAQREAEQAGIERKRQSLLRTEWEWVQRGVRARGTKSRSRLERYEALKNQETPETAKALELRSVSSRLGRKVLEAREISKAYSGQTLVDHFSYLVDRRDRLGIIGKNGCGKSTLLKLLSGALTPDSGEVVIGQTVQFGCFSQESEELEQLDTDKRVIEYIRDQSEYVQTEDGTLTAAQMLEKFLFPPDLQWTEIRRLSGGERRRLLLLHVLMQAPNVLLLDEPTNDLDIQTLMILEEYLEHFSGAVIAVSHDRYFLDKIADHILAFEEDGRVVEYPGGYSDYYAEHQAALRLTEERQKKQKEDSRKRNATSKKLKFSFREQYEFERIDDEIAALEQKLSEIEQEMEREASNFEILASLMEQKADTEQLLEEKMERWVYLNDLAEQIQAQNDSCS